jgi:hypothetical protein
LSRAAADRPRPQRGAASAAEPDPLVGFLVDRLTEDLALIWTRVEGCDQLRPGMAAQVAVIDELLASLRTGRVPGRSALRILLYGYGTHRDYDPAWTDRLLHLG